MPDLVTNYTSCIRIERTDGFVICLTDLDIDLTIDDNVLEPTLPVKDQIYLSAAGYTPTNMQSTSDNAVNNADIEGLLTSIGVNREDIIGGRYDFARIYMFLWDYNSNTLVKKLGSGHWGEATIKDNSYVAEYRSLSQQLQQTIGRTYNPECDAQLGDTRCTVNLSLYIETGYITGITDNGTFKTNLTNNNPPTLGTADDRFNYGSLTFDGNEKLDSYSGTVTSSGASPNIEFTDANMTEADDSRNNRLLTFTSGLNINESHIIESQLSTGYILLKTAATNPISITDNYILESVNNNYGLHMEVKDYVLTTNTFTLFLSMPFEVKIGDSFSVYTGCDKRLESCKLFDKEIAGGNIINYQGFPFIPGVDSISLFGGQ